MRSRVRRSIAIALVIAGVMLETAANLVQLAESRILHQAFAELSTASWPTRVAHALYGLWP